MNCNKCKKESTIQLRHLPALCDNCFLFTIERRVRRDLRASNPLKKGEKIAILNNGSKESKITEYILKGIAKDLPIELATINEPQEGFDKTFIPWNADDESNAFLEEVFENKPVQKGLKLLKSCSEEELQHMARILDLPQTTNIKKYSKLISAFEKTYPGTVFSIVKSVDTIKNL